MWKDINFRTPEPEGRVSWRSPSNIALIKYWGKKPGQVPANPSLSITLSEAYTETSIDYRFEDRPGAFKVDFFFEGNRDEQFGSKVSAYLKSLNSIIPGIDNLEMIIHSRNSFPHSSGIASSASAMSSLALCIASVFLDERDPVSWQKAVSYLARLGSGSASRSVFPGWSLWGKTGEVPGSSDDFAIPLPFSIHEGFRDMRDAVLIVSPGKKEVSSSAGHRLMETHPYREGRIKQVGSHLKGVIRALETGDWNSFIRIVENEALSLHGLMMSSNPSYMLMKPGTIEIIQKIRAYREQFHLPVCFTLDAGPNIHLLYDGEWADQVKDFIRDNLTEHCDGRLWIDDKAGDGPLRLE